ncbi:hypothetical protein [Trichothermofontia sp.]
MAVTPPLTAPGTAPAILEQVVRAFQQRRLGPGKSTAEWPSPAATIAALLQVEKATKQHRETYPLAALLGDWQLCFTTTGKVNLRQGVATPNRGFYLPTLIQAQIRFLSVPPPPDQPDSEPTLAMQNQLRLGPLTFQVQGPARYLAARNLLAFDVTQAHLRLVNVKGEGLTLYRGAFPSRRSQTGNFCDRPLAQLPFFSFFWVTPDAIAARGRGGGLAIWVRADP